MDQTLGSSSEDVLAQPVRGGRGLTTQDRTSVDLSSSIPGWGSDLDPSARPGVPMDKAPDIGVEALYPDIEQQVPRVKIHKSTEHARLTPVFGTSCPPRGLSGLIRDYAYKMSEGRISHWLLLMLADRVNVVEDFATDLAHFRVPNIPKEMGLKAEWKYNRQGVIRKVAIVGIALGVLSLVMKRRQRA